MKLNLLRKEILNQKLNGFVIPINDQYRNEWIPLHDQRLKWLTGFTGSAGIAIVLENLAALFVDGRYIIQAKKEVDEKNYEIYHINKLSPYNWLNKVLKNSKLGIDPWLHSQNEINNFQKICFSKNSKLVLTKENIIDTIWQKKPKPKIKKITIYNKKYHGQDSGIKRKKMALSSLQSGANNTFITSPESIAWLLNIRGGDTEYTPISVCYAILNKNSKVTVFIDKRKIDNHIKSSFSSQIEFKSIKEIDYFINNLSKKNNQTILLERDATPFWIYERFKEAKIKIINGKDPCKLAKSIKNKTEIDGIKNAHIRDGSALVKFLYWIDRNKNITSISELDICNKLLNLRKKNKLFNSLSFPTISGSGPNGAIVHYRVDTKSDRKLKFGDLLLFDSGAQYFDGTTDVTRTIAIGKPSNEQIDRFTRVLKGHISISSCIFPNGTRGAQLDSLGRIPLWEIGLDYDHGTGHGVGAFLNVHEGPQNISKSNNETPLKPGMIISNEPGYYKEGKYGIRIENLILVRKSKLKNMMQFETLTMAPIDKSLINKSKLNDCEINWLNKYHSKIYKTLKPTLPLKIQKWLKNVTLPIN
ncbi:aminopeptidase P family protein [Alphaproteobacteria bacterium]|nr:aminopeptidase P family protein [Alphaproteobacteria bacterium]